jgi:hypothetical protein
MTYNCNMQLRSIGFCFSNLLAVRCEGEPSAKAIFWSHENRVKYLRTRLRKGDDKTRNLVFEWFACTLKILWTVENLTLETIELAAATSEIVHENLFRSIQDRNSQDRVKRLSGYGVMVYIIPNFERRSRKWIPVRHFIRMRLRGV